jgi:hypothetical protein
VSGSGPELPLAVGATVVMVGALLVIVRRAADRV